VDECAVQAGKLNALTLMLTGDGFETFSSLNDDAQRNLLWLLDDLSSQVAALSKLASEISTPSIVARASDVPTGEASHV
jgi:hypothetical protein